MARANGSPMTKIVREKKMCIRTHVYMYVRMHDAVCSRYGSMYAYVLYVCMYTCMCAPVFVYMCERKGKREKRINYCCER